MNTKRLLHVMNGLVLLSLGHSELLDNEFMPTVHSPISAHQPSTESYSNTFNTSALYQQSLTNSDGSIVSSLHEVWTPLPTPAPTASPLFFEQGQVRVTVTETITKTVYHNTTTTSHSYSSGYRNGYGSRVETTFPTNNLYTEFNTGEEQSSIPSSTWTQSQNGIYLGAPIPTTTSIEIPKEMAFGYSTGSSSARSQTKTASTPSFGDWTSTRISTEAEELRSNRGFEGSRATKTPKTSNEIAMDLSTAVSDSPYKAAPTLVPHRSPLPSLDKASFSGNKTRNGTLGTNAKESHMSVANGTLKFDGTNVVGVDENSTLTNMGTTVKENCQFFTIAFLMTIIVMIQ